MTQIVTTVYKLSLNGTVVGTYPSQALALAAAVNAGTYELLTESQVVVSIPPPPPPTLPQPVITSLSPTSGGPGTVITLKGTGFTGAASAYSGIGVYTQNRWVRDCAVTVLSDTQCQMTIPADGGTGQIFIGNSALAGWAQQNFTFVASVMPPAPTGLTATAGDGHVTLGWLASTLATSYHVKRSSVAGGPFTTVLGSPTSPAYVDSAVTNSATYYYVVSAVDAVGESANSAQMSATPQALPTGAVTITVDPTKAQPISPYIYGLNFAGSHPGVALNRAGGNRWTAYNWTNNASNAGSDYLYENDAYLDASTVPAHAMTALIAQDQAAGRASLVSVQLQGLVAADKSGPVSTATPPDMTRFVAVVPAKGAAFSSPPQGNPVAMDEFLGAIDQAFPGQLGQSIFVSLDNEPELWNSTHLEIQGKTGVSSDAFIAKTVALAQALKAKFPGVILFGPVNYGFYGLYAWNGEMAGVSANGPWFVDKYVAGIQSGGKPLIDVYDFHWYPEGTDSSGARITGLTGATLTDDQIQAIVQNPRSFWDPTYVEKSWITQGLGGAVTLLPRLAAKTPGMKLAITEYNVGGANHIAGTLALADALGVFGAHGLFAATYWPLGAEAYALAGLRAFRSFDGVANFGDTALAAVSSDASKVAVYVSTDSTKPGRVVMVAINRSAAAQVASIAGTALTGTAHLFQMTAATGRVPVPAGAQSVSGTSLALNLPPLSVTTVDIY